MSECGGVLIPDGTRHCFVEERGLGSREFGNDSLRPSVDHKIPLSMGGSPTGDIHYAHVYCQNVQGAKCQPLAAKAAGGSAGIKSRGALGQSAAGKAGSSKDKARAGRLGGLATGPAKQRAASIAGRTSGHKRWHVNRGIVNPECDMCEASQ